MKMMLVLSFLSERSFPCDSPHTIGYKNTASCTVAMPVAISSGPGQVLTVPTAP